MELNKLIDRYCSYLFSSPPSSPTFSSSRSLPRSPLPSPPRSPLPPAPSSTSSSPSSPPPTSDTMYSSTRVDLDSVSKQLDGDISKRQGASYRFFKSKNETTEKQELELVTGYETVINRVKKSVTSVGNFLGIGKKALTTQNRSKPNVVPPACKPLHSRQPQQQPQQFERRTRANDGQELIQRCEYCRTALDKQRTTCQYCLKHPDIQIIDSDSDGRSFGQREMISAQMSTPRSSGIPTNSFYTKENNASRGSLNSSALNSSALNSSALNSSSSEANKKYEVDYMYVGTYRFLSRTFIRITAECLILNLYSIKEAVNVNFKLIRCLRYCTAKLENSKHVYIMVEFLQEAVEAINQYINRNPDTDGSFRFESINGHEKYFVMKLKYLQPIEVSDLKSKLQMYLPSQFKYDLNVSKIFEEQRQYCLGLRTRTAKRQKTSDYSKTRNQDNLRDSVTARSRDEPMEVETYAQAYSRVTRNNMFSRSSGYNTRSTGAYDKPSSLSIKKPLGSSTPIKLFDDDMEVSEVPQSDLSFKNIKNSKIVFETAPGEQLVIHKSDLFCLSDGNFLNDKIIEFYLIYIKSKLIDPAIAEKTYIFSSFFFTKMLTFTKGTLSDEEFNENLYNLVKNWTKNVDIFEYDYLIVPIFKSSHWSLAIVVHPGKMLVTDDFEIVLDDIDQKPCIIFMDSMGRSRASFNRYAKLLRNFLQKECAHKKNKVVDFSPKEMDMLDPEVPCQLNGYDCGIFILHYVELFLKNLDSILSRIRSKKLDDWFSSSDLKGKRKEIFTILQGIHDENLSNNLKFESDEDATLKSDEEIEILTSDQSDARDVERNQKEEREEKMQEDQNNDKRELSDKEIKALLSDDDDDPDTMF